MSRSTLAILWCLLLGACDSAPASKDAKASAEPPAANEPAPPAAAIADAPPGPPTMLEVPAWTNEGDELEVAKLYEDERMKVAAIALRRGKELPVHEVPAKVSIHVLSGAGTLRVGEQAIEVGPGSILILDPKAPHAMTPADDALVVLLVHYDKG